MKERELADALLTALDAGERAVLCTVVATAGSAPRGAGAKMAVLPDGRSLGTVGGGRVEQLAIRHARELPPDAAPHTLHSALDGAGMICGGEVTLCFTPLTPALRGALQRWRDLLAAHSPGWFCLSLTGQGPALTVTDREPDARPALYREPFGREGTVYLFGAGHVSRALVPVLAGVEFPVVVYDARPALADPAAFPGADRVLCGSFAAIAEHLTVTPRDYVVVMTPGHADDLTVLLQVMPCRPAYLGCIGSRTKAAATRRALAEHGFSEEEIRRLQLPIGLAIGARTPAEIAVSIAAQMIAARAALRGDHSPKPCPEAAEKESLS